MIFLLCQEVIFAIDNSFHLWYVILILIAQKILFLRTYINHWYAVVIYLIA
jgi:hypothetical protein